MPRGKFAHDDYDDGYDDYDPADYEEVGGGVEQPPQNVHHQAILLARGHGWRSSPGLAASSDKAKSCAQKQGEAKTGGLNQCCEDPRARR